LKNVIIRSGSNVEEWLRNLEEAMITQLKNIMKIASREYNDADRKIWVLQNYPSQIVLAVGSIKWTFLTEYCFQAEDPAYEMDNWHQLNISQLQDLTNLIRTDLTDIQRKRIVALVTQDVHYRDILEKLKNEQVDNINDFRWQQQLRFYEDDQSGGCFARQVNSKLLYGYEYLGVPSRLVITPLTDRCWMTITGALHIKLGAAPAGPAGTGKTESTKDLAKALGRFCVVFNCSEQITVKMMEKLFSGLCYTGSWACLDEFNRINIEVLSVIAQQVMTIRNALVDNLSEFIFGGKTAKLNPHMGIFITMNPGYAGRTELPDNLKVLFRPVAMMVPDYALIAEIMLFAEGFSEAKDLSRKMTKLYKLASEQLSQQDHYDFGMRAVKSVLVMAGALKRAEPNLSEDIVLIRAMRDSNIPKFLSHDLPLFNAIITDLFPGAVIPKVENEDLVNEIKEQLNQRKLPQVDTFVEKVVQYHETLKVRFGVMLVGPTMSGKSTVLHTLKDSYTALAKKREEAKQPEHPDFRAVDLTILNPKAISMEELFGNFDNFTQEWTDGLASKYMREYASRDTGEKRWVMFDGPVDALWIENMNTVLDDNMMLCLSNGQRIKLKWQMRMLFEVQDLAVASPATVSRCGMVYLDQQAIGIDNIIRNYVYNILGTLLPPNNLDQIVKAFAIYYSKAIVYLRRYHVEPIGTVEANLVHSIVKIIEMILRNSNFKMKDLSEESVKKALDKIFIFSFIWGVSSSIDPSSLTKFETFMTSMIPPSDLPRGSLYDSFLSYASKPEGEFVPWVEITPPFVYSKEKNYFDLIVPTKDTVRYSWFLQNSIKILHSMFFTGVTGTGKTIIIGQTLESMQVPD